MPVVNPKSYVVNPNITFGVASAAYQVHIAGSTVVIAMESCFLLDSLEGPYHSIPSKNCYHNAYSDQGFWQEAMR